MLGCVLILAFAATLFVLPPSVLANGGPAAPQVLRAPGTVAGGDTASITFDAVLATQCKVAFAGPRRLKAGPYRQNLRGGILRVSFRVNRKAARGAWQAAITCKTGSVARTSRLKLRVKDTGRRARKPLVTRRSFRFGIGHRRGDDVTQTLTDQSNEQAPDTGQLGAGPYDNGRIADIALSKLGQRAGQCKQAVNNWVREASGGGQRLGGDYFSNYAAQGGVQVSRDQAVKGDIIQLHNPADERGYYWPMHTAVVLSHQAGSNVFEVVDSNYGGGEIVRRHSYDPYRAAAGRLRVTIWRMGTAGAGGGTSGPAPGGTSGPMVTGRIGLINGAGALYVKSDLGQPFDQQTANGDASALALTGSRIGVINGGGAAYVKKDLGQPFDQQTVVGDAKALALSGNRIAIINGGGAMYVKSDLGQPFDQQTANGDATAIALSGTRIGVINGCGAAYVKRDLGQPFNQQTSCGDAKALALSGNRIAIINGCGALYVKSDLDQPFDQQTACGDATKIALPVP